MRATKDLRIVQALLLLGKSEPCSERHIKTIIRCGIDSADQVDIFLPQGLGLVLSVLKLLFLSFLLCKISASNALCVPSARSQLTCQLPRCAVATVFVVSTARSRCLLLSCRVWVVSVGSGTKEGRVAVDGSTLATRRWRTILLLVWLRGLVSGASATK